MTSEESIGMKSTSGNISNRILNIFKMYGFYLKGTDAETAYDVYMSVAASSRSDLKTLRDSLNVFRDDLTGHTMLFGAVSNLLQVVENELMFQQLGSIMPHSNLNAENTKELIFLTIASHIIEEIAGVTTVEGYATAIACSFSALSSSTTTSIISKLIDDINAGSACNDISLAASNLKNSLTDISLAGTVEEQATQITNIIIDGEYIVDSSGGDQVLVRDALMDYSNSYLYVTLSSAFGNGDFSAVSAADDNTVSGVIGNEALVEVNYLGKNTAAPGSLSEGFKTSNTALEEAIGVIAVAPTTPITFTMCTKQGVYSLGDVVYTTKDNLATKLNAISSCGKHSLDSGGLHYTIDGTIDGCTGPVKSDMFSGECISYFNPDS